MFTIIILNLEKLSLKALSRIRAPFRPGIYHDETVIETHAHWRSTSPVCRIDGVRWCPSIVIRPQHGRRTTAKIAAKVNVSLALFGSGSQHALSVHAAGLAALELLRIELASHGLPREELDRLGDEDVRLAEAVATYFVPCLDRVEVLHLLENIDRAGAVLNPRARSNLTTDFTVTLPYRGFTVVASACQSPRAGQVVDYDLASDTATGCTSHALRLDVRLRDSYTEYGPLTEWRDADAVDLYESLFVETVREKLRFDGHWLTHQFPDVDNAYLPPAAKQLLLLYRAGNDPRQFKEIVESACPKKELANLALLIRDRTRIDINVPWKYHATLRCEEMEQRLRYAEIWQTSAPDYLWYINDNNWELIKQALDARYEEVLRLEGNGRHERTCAPII